MFQIACIIVVAQLTLMVVQTAFAVAFVRTLRSVRPQESETKSWPVVSIVLPLRGADPSLSQSIHDLLHLDYPNYELRIVVDSELDPAWKLVEATLFSAQAMNVSATVISQRSVTCGLQCCALTEAVAQLPRETSVIVLVDGDVQAHPQLLKQLVAPLREPGVGLSFGNRWFTPPDKEIGAWVRYLWNAAAVVPMYVYGIPWGGCCAIRRDAIDKAALLNVWQRSIVPDAPIKHALDRIGLQVRFVPALMIAIPESCSLRFAHDFIKRQMLWTRLYHPHYAPVLAHAIITSSIMLISALCGCVFCINGNFVAGLIALGGLLGYLGWSVLLVRSIDNGVRHVFFQRGRSELGTWHPPWLKMPWMVIMTQLVYASAVIRATFARQVSWRGIQYAIKGPFEIQRLNDPGFVQDEVQREKQVSL